MEHGTLFYVIVIGAFLFGVLPGAYLATRTVQLVKYLSDRSEERYSKRMKKRMEKKTNKFNQKQMKKETKRQNKEAKRKSPKHERTSKQEQSENTYVPLKERMLGRSYSFTDVSCDMNGVNPKKYIERNRQGQSESYDILQRKLAEKQRG